MKHVIAVMVLIGASSLASAQEPAAGQVRPPEECAALRARALALEGRQLGLGEAAEYLQLRVDLTACEGGYEPPPRPEPPPPATLEFAFAGTQLPGAFRTVDGRPVLDAPATLELRPGPHTVGYQCPDVNPVDAEPRVTAIFESGRAYVLECGADRPGKVGER